MVRMLLFVFILWGIAIGQEKYDTLEQYVDTPEIKQRTTEKSYYGEILNRTDRVISGYDRGTNAHENIHMINSHYSNKTSGRKRAFYITGESRVFYTHQPKLFKNDVKSYVPKSVRGSRFQLYLEGSPAWNDTPTYIMDEWVAYIGGGMVAVEDHDNGINKDKSDRMCGPLEFSVYTIALCMAIEEKDNKFWQEEKDFRNFVGKMLVKAEDVFYKGRYIEDFRSSRQEGILKALRTSEDASRMRAFNRKWFGGAFLEDK